MSIDDYIRVQKRHTALELALMKRAYRDRLLFALQEIPPPPCTTCIHWQKCADESLACEGFKRYVTGGHATRAKDMNPNSKIYGEIYGGDE